VVRSSTAYTNSQYQRVNHSNYIYNPARTTETDKNFSTGGRKGKPTRLSGSKAKNQSTVPSPESWVKKHQKTTQDSRFRTVRLGYLAAEASRSCELTAEISFQQTDSKATKGGL